MSLLEVMIELMAIIIGLSAWVFLLFYTFGYATDGEFKKAGLTGFVWFILTALFLHHLIKYEENNPCLEYGQRMQLNPSTNTMMSVRYCKERGEWED